VRRNGILDYSPESSRGEHHGKSPYEELERQTVKTGKEEPENRAAAAFR